jgi:hypothetical protein
MSEESSLGRLSPFRSPTVTPSMWSLFRVCIRNPVKRDIWLQRGCNRARCNAPAWASVDLRTASTYPRHLRQDISEALPS